MVTDVVLGAVFLQLLLAIAAFYRYSHTEAFRHGDLRRATFELLVTIGPFFGVHPKPIEPEPPAVLTPKGDDDDDPLAGRVRISSGDDPAAKAPEDAAPGA